MPLLFKIFLGLFISVIGGIVARTLVSLGIAVATYTGIDYAFDFLKSLILQHISMLPATAVQILSLLKIGTALSIVFSCMFASMVLAGVSNGTFKKWIQY